MCKHRHNELCTYPYVSPFVQIVCERFGNGSQVTKSRELHNNHSTDAYGLMPSQIHSRRHTLAFRPHKNITLRGTIAVHRLNASQDITVPQGGTQISGTWRTPKVFATITELQRRDLCAGHAKRHRKSAPATWQFLDREDEDSAARWRSSCDR